MKILFLIPARGGSKGIKDKNIQKLGGKELIRHSIDYARNFTSDEHICLSTDSPMIKKNAEEYGLKVSFIRPETLSSDTTGSYEVMLHALDHYRREGKEYDLLVLLQPTSPFRKRSHYEEALRLFHPELDMVVSVKEPHSNPYWNLFRENENGYLEKFSSSNIIRRQDAPKVYEYNGALYLINTSSLRMSHLGEFSKVRKLVMDEFSSVDIDVPIDLQWADFLIQHGHVKPGA